MTLAELQLVEIEVLPNIKRQKYYNSARRTLGRYDLSYRSAVLATAVHKFVSICHSVVGRWTSPPPVSVMEVL